MNQTLLQKAWSWFWNGEHASFWNTLPEMARQLLQQCRVQQIGIEDIRKPYGGASISFEETNEYRVCTHVIGLQGMSRTRAQHFLALTIAKDSQWIFQTVLTLSKVRRSRSL